MTARAPLVPGRGRSADRKRAGRPDALTIGDLGELPEALTPLALILPGQLLAEAVAVRLGLSPDAPAGLSKVTLTR